MNSMNDWNECVAKHCAISVSIDTGKIASLIDTAKGRITFLKSCEITQETANYIFEGYYSSVLELLHAIVLENGFKVTNHICLGFYVRDIIKHDSLFRTFDDCRYKRNSLVYYGRKMDLETSQEAIHNCEKLFEEFMLLLT